MNYLWLKQRRLANNWAGRTIAKSLDMPLPTVYLIENHQEQLPTSIASKYANKLGVGKHQIIQYIFCDLITTHFIRALEKIDIDDDSCIEFLKQGLRHHGLLDIFHRLNVRIRYSRKRRKFTDKRIAKDENKCIRVEEE